MTFISRFLMICLLGALALPLAPSLAQPVSLNSAWEFVPENNLTLATVSTVQNWETVNLPHTWNRLDPYDEADGYRQGVGWYRKSLFLSRNGRDRIWLKFEGANEHAAVFLNGQEVTEHMGGYTAFMADLTPYVQWDQENTLLVRVSNRMNALIPPLSMDFTFYGGIYRDVWLIRKADQHFDHGGVAGPGVYLSTPEISAESAQLSVAVHLKNEDSRKKAGVLRLELRNPDGEVVATKEQALSLPARNGGKETLSLLVDRPHLWHPDDPALYRVTVRLLEAGTGVEWDLFSARYGFRWVAMDANRALLLNGQPLKLMGSCRHQDYPGFGSAMPDQLHRQDVVRLKAMGGNFIRIAHYPQDPAVLEACDELGLLAWEELPIVNSITVSDSFQLVSTQMLEEMIAQHRNHASVIMWGLMNEILLRVNVGLRQNPQLDREAYLRAVRDLTQHLHDHAKSLDPLRWTTIAHHGNYALYEEAGMNAITDVVGWNLYGGWYRPDMQDSEQTLDQFHRDHPSKGIIISEFGGGSDPRIHAIDPRRFDFSIEWQTGIHADYLPLIRRRPEVMGCALWLLTDFNSEGRKDAVPHINSKGILNLDRSPKDSYLYYQAALAQSPYLEIGSLGWRKRAGFAGPDGSLSQPIFLFTNQPEVRLALNGKDLGTFAVENYHLRLMLPLVQGRNELKVEASGLSPKYAVLEADVYPADLRTLNPDRIDLRMNLGAHFFFTHPLNETVWLPEQPYTPGGIGYVGGKPLLSWNGDRVGSDREIFGSDHEPVYQTHRDSLIAFRADLPEGWYEITAHFAEVIGKKAREKLAYNLGADAAEAEIAAESRHFHLKINGRTVMRDIVLTDYQATSFRLQVQVQEQEGLTIEVVPVRGGAMLSGVEIHSLR
jgi:beta-galactosidase